MAHIHDALYRRSIFRHLRLWPILAVLIAGVFAFLIVGLICIIFWLSSIDALPGDSHVKYTADNYSRIFLDSFTYKVLLNTAIFSLISLGISFIFGVPIAWIVERTNLPGKNLVFTLMSIGLLIPGYITAMGWVFLLHPKIGVFNQYLRVLLDLDYTPLNVTTITGMGFVQGLSFAPLAFIMTASVFRSMDPALEEAAQISGANLRRTIRFVTLPLIRPGLLSAAIYIFTLGVAVFDVPAVIGWSNRIYTFSTYIYLELSPQDDLPHYGGAAALSTCMVFFAALLTWWLTSVQKQTQRYQVITGRAYQPRMTRLGLGKIIAWTFIGLYFLLSKGIPLILLLWVSGLPYFMQPSISSLQQWTMENYRLLPWDLLLRGGLNTGVLMVLTPSIVVPLSLVFAWIIVRSRLPGRSVFDFVSFLPHAVPNIIFGVGALLFALFILSQMVPIYGTVWLLLGVFVIIRLSYATRMANSALIQIHRELEEAAFVSGAGYFAVFRKILLPIITPTILYSWLWVALLSYRELTVAVLLSTPGNITLPVVIWSIWLHGGLGQASAVTVIMMVILVPIVALYWLIARRSGIVGRDI